MSGGFRIQEDADGRFQDARRHRRHQGQARAGPGRPQRADGRRQGHRRHPHRARRADHPRTLRQGRQGRPARAFRPARRTAPIPNSRWSRSPAPTAEIDRPAGRASSPDCIGEKAAGAIFAHEARRHPAAGKHPLPQGRGEERPGLHREARRQWRHLRQRRLLGRAPRACLDRGPRRISCRPCRPHHAGRARGAGEGPRQSGAAGRRHRRRRQGLDQARPA